MLQFVLGALFGGLVTLVTIAIISINKTDDERIQFQSAVSEESGDSDAGK